MHTAHLLPLYTFASQSQSPSSQLYHNPVARFSIAFACRLPYLPFLAANNCIILSDPPSGLDVSVSFERALILFC